MESDREINRLRLSCPINIMVPCRILHIDPTDGHARGVDVACRRIEFGRIPIAVDGVICICAVPATW